MFFEKYILMSRLDKHAKQKRMWMFVFGFVIVSWLDFTIFQLCNL